MNVMLTVSIISLLLGLFHMPYGYYFILKIIVCLTSIQNIYNIYTSFNTINRMCWLLIGLVVLYNPFIKIPLGRFIWTLVNCFTIMIFSFLIVRETNNNNIYQ